MIYAFRTRILTTCHPVRLENTRRGLSWVKVLEIISKASRKIKNSGFFTNLKKKIVKLDLLEKRKSLRQRFARCYFADILYQLLILRQGQDKTI